MSNFSYEEFNIDANEEISDEEEHILMHLDIDYFFAQVEILKRPELADVPVIVGHERARETRRGVVLTCNYPARKFGVHSGQPMNLALDKCPDAVIVKSTYDEYQKFSNIIMQVLKDLEVPMRKAGIDEAYIDLTPIVGNNYNLATNKAVEIKQIILDKTNLTVSVGVGPTLKIAKICSDYDKPDGITVIPPDKLDDLFNNLPLVDVPGIGQKTAERLKKRGFTTCDQMRKLNKAELVDLFGSHGLYYYKIFHGLSSNTIKPRGKRKSVSHSRTFIGDPGDVKKSMEMIEKLFESSYSTLIKEKFMTKTVGVTIRFNGFDTITRAQSLPYVTDNRDQLLRIALDLISPHLEDERGIRLLGVGFHNLEEKESEQKELDEFLVDPSHVSSDPLELLKELNPKTTKKKDEEKKKRQMDLSDFL